MSRRRDRHYCTGDDCPWCAWAEDRAELYAAEDAAEVASEQQMLDAADREARMDRWS